MINSITYFDKNDNRLKSYFEWKEEYENRHNIKIIDDDGARNLEHQGKLNNLMTYEEALKYLLICTQMWKGGNLR